MKLGKLFSSFLVLALLLAMIPGGALAAPSSVANPTTTVFINEIHYDNTSTDSGEAIEVAGPAGTDLTDWSIVLYNGSNGLMYDTNALSGIISDQQGGYGTVFLSYPTNGIQNGGADGIALIDASNTVVQFLSYEGILTAADGPAIGLTSTDIGVEEASTSPVGDSLQLTGTGTTYGDFTWAGSQTSTFGAVNTGQSFGGGTPSAMPLPLSEGFDNCTLVGWEIISVDSDTVNTWSCNETYSNIEANGYGDSAPANEWLITPALNLDAQENDTLTFRSYTNYTDINYPQLHVLYSTDYDGGGDPTSATWTGLTGINFSPENSGDWTDSGGVDLSGISGTNVYFAFQYESSGTGGGAAANWRLDGINFFEYVPPEPNTWVINEVNADPASDLSGDANGDGVRDSGNDEFVELVNVGTQDTDISGWTLSDGYGVRHTFPSGTVVPASCSIVVFGGGTPTGEFGTSVVQTASSGALGLNNGGDSVTLSDGITSAADVSYGGEGGDNQSLTRDPDITGPVPLVKHSTATGSGGALFSPGTKIDGSNFDGCPGKFIHQVQGSGDESPLVGKTVIIEGIVVGDFQDKVGANGDLNGFFVQEEDADADADPTTSEGIFVYQGSNPSVDVAIGDLVRVEGAVSEYNGMTELTSYSGVTLINSGNLLPTVSSLSLPVTAVDDFEAYEGMYVTFPQPLVISEYFNFDRYGEIVLTSERHLTPTAEFEPGSSTAAQAAHDFLLDKITLDDGRTTQNPDPAIHPNGLDFNLDNLFRGGDTVANVTGVINYDHDLYRVQPTEGATYTNANPRTASPDGVGGTLKVSSFNVLNYFTTIDDGSDNCGPLQDQECRGADTEEEFTRQRDKIIAAISAIDADVVGLIEIENNPGDVPTADLVNGLNDVMGAGTYDYIATGWFGTDAIRQAFIYKPATVSPVGAYAVLDDPAFTDPLGYGEEKSRPALAQTFMDNETGGVFTAVVNHLKSKGSSCGFGDDDLEAGSCNLTRTLAAQELVSWLSSDPTGIGDGDYLIIGDLNSYDKEDPIDMLLADGFADLVKQYQGEFAYSYVFDGQLGYLDHALGNADMSSEVTGVTIWHINADEPDLIDYDTSFKLPAQDAIYAPDAYRSSDHDPVIVGLELTTEQQINELIDMVQALVDDGALNSGQGNALISKLENVLAKLGKGNTKAAANQLGAFINQVEDFIYEGVLTAEQGNPLIKVATVLVEALSN